MTKRFLTIFAIHTLALLAMMLAYSHAESRPFNAEAVIVTRHPPMPREAEPPPSLPSLPEAGELPPPAKPGRPETGLGTRKFVRPGVAGYRLDWCAGPGNDAGCGPPAAQLFCQWEGYNRAVSMVEEQGVGLVEPTRRMASNTQCRGPNCSGFLSITCTKQR